MVHEMTVNRDIYWTAVKLGFTLQCSGNTVSRWTVTALPTPVGTTQRFGVFLPSGYDE